MSTVFMELSGWVARRSCLGLIPDDAEKICFSTVRRCPGQSRRTSIESQLLPQRQMFVTRLSQFHDPVLRETAFVLARGTHGIHGMRKSTGGLSGVFEFGGEFSVEG